MSSLWEYKDFLCELWWVRKYWILDLSLLQDWILHILWLRRLWFCRGVAHWGTKLESLSPGLMSEEMSLRRSQGGILTSISFLCLPKKRMGNIVTSGHEELCKAALKMNCKTKQQSLYWTHDCSEQKRKPSSLSSQHKKIRCLNSLKHQFYFPDLPTKLIMHREKRKCWKVK